MDLTLYNYLNLQLNFQRTEKSCLRIEERTSSGKNQHCQTSDRLQFLISKNCKMVGPGGFEPPTPRLSSVCSNQLSYGPAYGTNAEKLRASTRLVEPRRVELLTPCLQNRCSTN